MLTDIFIRNLAIVDELSVSFHAGFNVLTGETGAGKSIIIHALSFLLGERGDVDLIRAGEETMLVEAAFDLRLCQHVEAAAKTLDLTLEDDSLVLSRELSRSGRSRIRINGRPATLSMLRQLSEWLVDIHGQHEHQSLLQTSSHLRLLDTYGGEEQRQLLEDYRKLFRQFTEVESALAELRQSERDRIQRLDLLRFQADEIDKARLREGEDEALAQERQLLANAEQIAERLNNAVRGLSGDGVDHIAAAIQSLSSIASLDPAFQGWHEQLMQVQSLAQDVSFEIGRYLDRMEFDPQRLAEVEERLHMIQRLMRKYGDSIKVVSDYRAGIQDEIERLETSSERLEELQQERNKLWALLTATAAILSQARSWLAGELEATVQAHLDALAFERAEFRVAMESAPVPPVGDADGTVPFTKDGVDEVQFLITTNPGQPLKPLAKIASGGELSRVMLALKTSLQSIHDVPVLIFDEVDAGIGGRAAESVGQKLKEVARYAQVLCVTHLPQIASLANWHLKVEKDGSLGSTTVTVTSVQGYERTQELARMLSGAQVTEASLQHAREMLEVTAGS